MLSSLSDGDIRLLRIFAKVVEAGGFSAAQIDLNISQSTISTHMTALEQRLGVRLCQRGRSGFSLTEKGQRIHQAALQLFAAMDGFRTEAGAVRDRLVGRLAIGLVDNIVTNPASHLEKAIEALNRQAPEVEIAVHVVAPTDLERGVLDGKFDLGLGACGRHSPNLTYEDVFDEQQILYCGRGHALFERNGEVTLKDLKSQQLVRRAYAAPDLFPAHIRPTASAVADLMESVAVLILSGRYIGFLPQHFARQWVDQDRMRPLLAGRLGYRNPIYLTMRKSDKPSPVLSAFLEEFHRVQKLSARTDKGGQRLRRTG